MIKTKGNNTPGGTSVALLNNPPSEEVGPKDSGVGHLLQPQTPTQSQIDIYNYEPQQSINQEHRLLFSSGNYKRSENEELLYIEWRKAAQKNQEQNVVINNLHKQLEEIKNEIAIMKQNSYAPSTAKTSVVHTINSDYETDEDELAKETEWIRARHRRNRNKKRKLNNTPSPPQQQQERALSKANDQQKVKKIPPPPPLIVDGIKNYQEFYDTIKTGVPEAILTTKLVNENSIKINVENEGTYRAIVNKLTEDRIAFHSYENKQTRPIRVMIKNLHHSCSPERIVDELKMRQLKVLEVTNKLSWKEKKPLDMFLVSFSAEEDISKVYEMKGILGCKVEIVPLKKSKLTPQCKRCQAYGHTQKYCAKEARCVKCAGNHHTKDCVKPKNIPAKCIHCGEPHPANYRGCMVAKEIQKIKNRKENKPPTSKSVTGYNKEIIPNSQISTKKNTYAQIVANNNGNNIPDEDIKQTLQAILTKLNTFDQRLEKLERITRKANPTQK